VTLRPVQRAQVVVVGSGPGGAVTACLLAEAGKDVLILEEGDFIPQESCRPFSVEEMGQKYRNGGLTVALGKTKVPYVEGCCVGGGSEINSGLYHRTPPDILERWRREFLVEGLLEEEMLPFFEANERDLGVTLMPGPASPASLKLHAGATLMGWRSQEVPRWFTYDAAGVGRRNSMTKLFIPRALKAGARLMPGTRVMNLRREGVGWRLQATGRNRKERIDLRADAVFVAGGAVQTPALLRRSGLAPRAGRSFSLHPTVKVAAEFSEEVNSVSAGVPVHQVKEFAPHYSFGGSVSSLPFLSLVMADHADHLPRLGKVWRQMAIYYCMVSGHMGGSVRPLPFFDDPLVQYAVSDADMASLAEGLKNLCLLLFAAGARMLYPSVPGLGPFGKREDLAMIPQRLPAGLANLMSLHLFSSCPMGENLDLCVVDSFGRVHGQDGLYVADASLLCSSPGVNPQGSIMAVVRRNAMEYLERDKRKICAN